MANEIVAAFNDAWRDYVTDGVPASGDNDPDKAEIRAVGAVVQAQLDTLTAAQSGGYISQATWAELAALATTGFVDGTTGFVPDTDADTHTDPVVGGTVDNAGTYAFVVGDGWQRIGDTAALSAVTAAAGYVTAAGAAQTAAETAQAAAEAAAATAADGYSDVIDREPALDDGETAFSFLGPDNEILGRFLVDGSFESLLSVIRNLDGLELFEYETLDDTLSFFVADPDGRLIWVAGDVVVNAEVVTARGDRDSLADRLDQAIDAYGNPRDQFNANRLRQYHYRRRTRLLGESARQVLASIGDSYTHNYLRYTGPLIASLVTEQGDGGGGWTGFGFGSAGPTPYASGGAQPGSINGNARPATYGVTYIGDWTASYATVPSPDICCANSTTALDEIRAAYPASPTLSGVDFFWIGTADGVMEYSWDGLSWTTINVQGTVDACSFASLAGVPASGSGSLRLRVVSGTCRPAGVNWKSAADGAVLHKLGATGSRAEQWAAQVDDASWQAALAALAPTTVTVLHGTNDQGDSRTTAQFAADVQTIGEALRTAIPAVDLAIVMPAENQRSNTYPMKSYALAAAAVAGEQGWAFKDLQRDFGDPDDPSDYASGGTIPLFNSDGVHPEPATGGRAMLDALLRFLSN